MARKQTAKIWYQNALHKEIYFDGHYHDAMYKGAELMWKKLPNTPTSEWYGLVRQVVRARGKFYALVDTYNIYPPTTTSRLRLGIAEYDESAGGWVIFMITNFETLDMRLVVTENHLILGYLTGNLYIYDDDEWVEFDHDLLETDEWFSFGSYVYGKENYYEYYSGSGCGLTRHKYVDDYYPSSIPFEWGEQARVVAFSFNPETNNIHVFGKSAVIDEDDEEQRSIRYIIGAEYNVIRKAPPTSIIHYRCDDLESDCDLVGWSFRGNDYHLTIRVEYKQYKTQDDNLYRFIFMKNIAQEYINGNDRFFYDEQMLGSAILTNTGDYYFIRKTTKNSIYQYELWGGRSLVNMTKLNAESNMLQITSGYYEDSTMAHVATASYGSAGFSYDVDKSTNETTYNRMNFFKEG